MKVKFMAILAVMVLSLAMPMNVSAADKYDVNGDGKTNIMDVILINRYLMAQGSISDISSFDINEDGLVNSADSMCVMAKISSKSFVWGYIK